MHTYGYAIRGQTPCCHRLLVKGNRISVVAALSTEGIIDAQMHSFDGSSPQSILIMDNCSVHHVQEIQDLLASVGIPLIYLPPYVA